MQILHTDDRLFLYRKVLYMADGESISLQAGDMDACPAGTPGERQAFHGLGIACKIVDKGWQMVISGQANK
ncbi:hypothetical protein WH50_07035 [Pokkaliibacter plantistimulans]|uniref:Uncharacterized protein n=1 Tax=Pokkaliibacter plantistimulans TaxID=1635171 RepID=A0ABX5M2J5_9GAMM|nr:hypothetical protein WH50_07035 [Pokkaliibacter plantistimulans]